MEVLFVVYMVRKKAKDLWNSLVLWYGEGLGDIVWNSMQYIGSRPKRIVILGVYLGVLVRLILIIMHVLLVWLCVSRQEAY